MNPSAAEILKRTVKPEEYRKSLLDLNGDFDFSLDSMMSLGEVYCDLYPDSVSHSDSAQVQIGYKLVRISIVEIILKDIDPSLKSLYREMLISASAINQHMPEIVQVTGHENAVNIHKSLDSRIKELKTIIDNLPNSAIKERFTGGISVFYNTLYLMKKSLNI